MTGLSEYIRNAFDSIWAHKLRSMLTMLGIIIGIASIIAISSTIMGTNEQIKNNLVGAGNNVVTARIFQGNYEMEFEYQNPPEGVAILDEAILPEIQTIPHVKNASIYYRRNAYNAVCCGSTVLSMGTILGIDDNYMDVYGYVMKAGRNFVEEDFTKCRKVALIDSAVSRTLFHGVNPIGNTIEIVGEPYIVVGEITTASKFSPVIESISDYEMYMDTSGGTIFIPMTTWPVVYKYDEPISVAAQADDVENMTVVGNTLVDILNSHFTKDTGEVKYKSDDILQKAKDLQELSASTNNQLIWIASISLLVGGIGVMNIMLVSVTERTREIGLKKALGAKRRMISTQFLMEAGLLTCFGGILGVMFGMLLAFVISRATKVPIYISWAIVVASVVFSFIIGLFFGVIPATKASKLNPIEALRRE